MKLMYITNRPEIALIAEKNGVDRIFVDLETLGKEDRQKNMDTVKSKHTVEDVACLAERLTKAELLVRVNPWNENSKSEIDRVIEAGADVVMLPMWKTKSEVVNFLNAVDGRVKTMLLLETREAVDCLDDVLELCGIDEIHIGLNDLHLSYQMCFMFELLADGTVERLCTKIAKKGIPYGFGGVGRIGEGLLLAEHIICEHYRLQSQGVILSRSFCNQEHYSDFSDFEELFHVNIAKIRAWEKDVKQYSPEQFNSCRKLVILEVEKVIQSKRS